MGLARSRKGLPDPEYLPCDGYAKDECEERCGCRGVLACQLVITPKLIALEGKGTVYRLERTVNCECGDGEPETTQPLAPTVPVDPIPVPRMPNFRMPFRMPIPVLP